MDLRGGGGQHLRDTFFLENYGTDENPITIGGMSGGTLLGDSSDPNNRKRVIGIGNNSHLKFENITFKDGCIVTGGEAPLHGVGLYIDENSKVTLLNGTRVIGNTTHNDGGMGESMGGGIYIENGSLTIDGAEITKNEAIGNAPKGGGLYAGDNTKVTIKSGLFTVNKAKEGAGVYIAGNAGASFAMTGGTISANTATQRGGGIYVLSGTPTIRGAKILSNSATGATNGYGGGIYVNGGTLTIDGAEISDNTAGYSGGGIRIADGGTVQINGGVIRRNTAIDCNGGGIYTSGNLTLTGAEITENAANGDGSASRDLGGGVCVAKGTMTYNSGRIHGNTSIKNIGHSIVCYTGSGAAVTPAAILTQSANISATAMDYENGDIGML